MIKFIKMNIIRTIKKKFDDEMLAMVTILL